MEEYSQSLIMSENILSEKDDIRCPICYLIPLILKIDFSANEPIIKMQCQNNHLITKKLKVLYNEFKNIQINRIKCFFCDEMDSSKLFYCIKCYKFLCIKEKNKHSINEHKLIPIHKIDSGCWNEGHNFSYVTSFCYTHNKNICVFCKEDHKNDKIEDFTYIRQEEIDKLENKIIKMRTFINNLTKRVNKFVSELEQFKKELVESFQLSKENYEIQLCLVQDLFNSYKLKKQKNQFNYQIIHNLKNIIIKENDMNENENMFEIFTEIKQSILEYFKTKQYVYIRKFNQDFLQNNNNFNINLNILNENFGNLDFGVNNNHNNNNFRELNNLNRTDSNFIIQNNEERIGNNNFRIQNNEERNGNNNFRIHNNSFSEISNRTENNQKTKYEIKYNLLL